MIIMVPETDYKLEDFTPGNIIIGNVSDHNRDFHVVAFRVVREATKEEYIECVSRDAPNNELYFDYDEPLYFFEVLMD